MRFQLIALLFFFLLTVNMACLNAQSDSGKCEHSKKQASIDLQKGKVELLIQCGIVPVHVKGEESFELTYKVQYRDLSCMIPKGKCIAAYNREVAKFLDKKNGKAWRKQVRKDVTGV